MRPTTITIQVHAPETPAQARIEELLAKGALVRLTPDEMTELLNLTYWQAFERNMQAMNQMTLEALEAKAA